MRPPGRNILLLAVIWLVALFAGSVSPFRSPLARAGTLSHLVLHAAAFGFPAFLLSRLSHNRTGTAITLAITLSLATGIEILQRVLYSPLFEWPDLLADFAGIALAGGLLLLSGRRAAR